MKPNGFGDRTTTLGLAFRGVQTRRRRSATTRGLAILVIAAACVSCGSGEGTSKPQLPDVPEGTNPAEIATREGAADGTDQEEDALPDCQNGDLRVKVVDPSGDAVVAARIQNVSRQACALGEPTVLVGSDTLEQTAAEGGVSGTALPMPAFMDSREVIEVRLMEDLSCVTAETQYSSSFTLQMSAATLEVGSTGAFASCGARSFFSRVDASTPVGGTIEVVDSFLVRERFGAVEVDDMIADIEVGGTLEYVGDCPSVDLAPTIWPAGTRVHAATMAIISRDGTQAEIGMGVGGDGLRGIGASGNPDDVPDQKARAVFASCGFDRDVPLNVFRPDAVLTTWTPD